jgi:HK97 gp10 family phage protein
MPKKAIETSGLDKILQQIEAIGGDVDTHRKEILYEAGKELQKAIKEGARGVDDGEWTTENAKYGTIEQNIWLEWDEKTKTTYVTTGNAYWAIMVEYGYGNHKGPKPFMENAHRAAQAKINKIIAKELKRRLGL